MQPRNGALRWFAISIALVLASCGDGSADGHAHRASKPAAARANEARGPAPEPAQLDKLFGERDAPRTPAEEENLRRNDPAYDGWPSEVAANRVLAQVEALLPKLWNAPYAEVAPFLAENFEGATELRPAQLDSLFDDGRVRVRRTPGALFTLREPKEFAALLDELRRPFAGARVRTTHELVAIDLDGTQRMGCELWVQAFALVDGAPVQQNARWRVEWSCASDVEAPRLRSLRLLALEEVHCNTTFFADHTGRVFGDNPTFAREFQLGVGDYYFKNDHLTGNAALGGQGVAVGDVDADGLDDVYVSMQGGLPNRLFLHQADGTAREASNEARVAILELSRSSLIIDVDNDGHQDIVSAFNSNVLVAFNAGNGVFENQVVLKGPGEEEIFSLAAADPDNDGDLDLYCCRYSKDSMIGAVPTPYCDSHDGAPDIYWRNEGGRRFKDATNEAGFGSANDRYGLAAIWEDLDDDGDLDLYVANDFGRNNLFLNEGGQFRDVALERGADDMAAGMGATASDFDLDGDFDLYTSNMFSAAGLRCTRIAERFMGGKHLDVHPNYVRHARGNTLLRNRGGGSFEDVSEAFGVTRGGWAWGAKFVDLDNDGYDDLYVPNGFITFDRREDVSSFFWRRVISLSPPAPPLTEEYREAWASIQRMAMTDGMSWAARERNNVYFNLRGTSFADASACSGADFDDDSRAVAVVDWDDDGALDLLLKNRTAPRLRLLRNQAAAQRHWLALELRGSTCNRDAIGARVTVELEGRTLRTTLRAGEGYLAQSSKRLHFGLADATEVKRVNVRWPDGSTQSFDKLAIDTRYRIVQGERAPTPIAARTVKEFASAAPTPLARLPGGVRRIALVERVPLSALPLPELDGSPRTVADFAGKPALITLWSSKSDECVDEIAALGRWREAAAELGLRLVTVSIDEGQALLAARQLLAVHGLERDASYADGHLKQLLEVLMITVFGRSKDVPLPISLLVDARGEWALAYPGPLDFAVLRADVDVLASLGDKRKTDRLFGGRWIARPRRNWSITEQVLRELGAPEMAAMYTAAQASASVPPTNEDDK